MKFKILDLHDSFIETLFWINLCLEKNEFKLQIVGSLALSMLFLYDCFGISLIVHKERSLNMWKYQLVWKKVNFEIWNHGKYL